ncbi:MAG: M14 family metallopeptidase [Gammaproteobacteria bacterium]
MLTILNELPDGLLDYNAEQLHEVLNGPTLIHLEGELTQPVFISVLLHGNEHSGWQAIQALFRNVTVKLPRSISIFIGNVSAAKQCLRHLPDQLDYNRIWNGIGDSAEHTMVRQVLEEMRARSVFAVIDVHNNTGFNPHYACINSLEDHFKYFARQFGPLIVYFKQPDSVLSIAFAQLCPTVTVECGLSGDINGIQRVVSFIENTISMKSFPDSVTDVDLISIYQTVAVIKIPTEVSIDFGEGDADVKFDVDLEQFNFREIHANSNIAKIKPGSIGRMVAVNDNGEDVTTDYFYHQDDYIKNRISIIPAMLTQNIEIVKNDCLCYLMTQIE